MLKIKCNKPCLNGDIKWKIKKATLYIIQGFIGAGKSTFSRKLALETGAAHFNPDEWVSKLYYKEEYMKNWNECFDKAVSHLWEITRESLMDGLDVIFDMGFLV